MKKKLLMIFFGLALCGVFLNAQTLDEAILSAAVKISRDLPSGVTAAIIDFKSNSDELNAYVINALHGAILRSRRITSLRLNQEQHENIRGNLSYNAAGELSAELAQNIGRSLGVQYLITGLLELSDSDYNIAFNAFDTNAYLQSQYTSSLNPRNNAQLASFLGSAAQPEPVTASETASQTKAERAQNEAEQENKLVSLKFSLGEKISIFGYDVTDHYYLTKIDDSYSAAYLNYFTLALSLRLLFSPADKLRLGIGLDGAIPLNWGVQITSENNDGYNMNLSFTLAAYAIFGYSNYYLHTGYDFVLGALYAAPVWAANKNLLISLPMSLFGNNWRRPSFYNLGAYENDYIDLDSYKRELKSFQIGLSIQYVF